MTVPPVCPTGMWPRCCPPCAICDWVPSRAREAALALIAAQILEPSSKLAASRWLRVETCHHTLAEEGKLSTVNEEVLYAARDWLVARQSSIEAALARQHLRSATLVLYERKGSVFGWARRWVRPNCVPDRVRAQVFLTLLAYYVEWHMRRALAPARFDDEQRGQPSSSPVSPARRSPEARQKARCQRPPEGWPVQSFQDWLKDLATITRNHIQPRLRSLPAFQMITHPTPYWQCALELLRIKL